MSTPLELVLLKHELSVSNRINRRIASIPDLERKLQRNQAKLQRLLAGPPSVRVACRIDGRRRAPLVPPSHPMYEPTRQRLITSLRTKVSQAPIDIARTKAQIAHSQVILAQMVARRQATRK